MDDGAYRPRPRTDGLLIEPLGEELLVCDVGSDAAHVLNETAARVWRACDGNRDLEALQAQCGLDEDIVALALERLHDCWLLDESAVPRGISRRTMLRRSAIGAGLGVALPAISSIIVPTPAMAASVTTTAAPTTTTTTTTTTTPAPTTTASPG